MDIKIFLHLIDNVSKYRESADIIVDRLIYSGLLNTAELNIYHQYSFDENAFSWLKEKLKKYPKINFYKGKGFPKDYEIPTIIELKNVADSLTKNTAILYLHHKSATKTDNEPEACWTDLLLYFTVEKWKEHVAALEFGYDLSGTWFEYGNPGCFPGNFWWASSNYIKTLSKLEYPSKNGFKHQTNSPYSGGNDGDSYREDGKFWIGTGLTPDIKVYTHDARLVLPNTYSPGWSVIDREVYVGK